MAQSSFNCTPPSAAPSLSLTSQILPALDPTGTTAYTAPAALTFPPANRCRVTVNLHCAYVTFEKLHCPCSCLINSSRGNWMLIGQTIDQSTEKPVREQFDDAANIDKQEGARQSLGDRNNSSLLLLVVCRANIVFLQKSPLTCALRIKSICFFFFKWEAVVGIWVYVYLKGSWSSTAGCCFLLFLSFLICITGLFCALSVFLFLSRITQKVMVRFGWKYYQIWSLSQPQCY